MDFIHVKLKQDINKPPEQNFSLGFWLFAWNVQLFVFLMITKKEYKVKNLRK